MSEKAGALSAKTRKETSSRFFIVDLLFHLIRNRYSGGADTRPL